MPDSGTASGLAPLVEQLAGESHPLRRHKLMQAARELWEPDTVQRLYDESIRLMHVNVAQAERLARSASWLSGKLEDDGSKALGFRAMGNIYYLKGKYEEANDEYLRALSIYERLDKELEIGRTLSGSLQSLGYLGRYDEAMAAAKRAYEIFAKHGDRLRVARLNTNMGNLVFRQDRFEEALELYQRSCDEFAEIGDTQDVAIALKNIATCQIFMSDFRRALTAYHRARTYALEHEMPLLAAGADYNIAYLHYLRGEYTRAIEMYRAAREHCHELGDTYREGLCDLDQSEMYLELNLSEEGAHLARRALTVFRQLGMVYEAAKAVTNLAVSASHHGDTALSLQLFRKAHDLFAEEDNVAWMAIIDLYQALVLHRDRRLTEAMSLAENALAFFSNSPLAGKASLSKLLISRIHLDAGRPEAARAVCMAALQGLDQAETPALSYQAWFVLGLIEESLGAPEAARQAYVKAHGQMENLRSHLHGEEVKIAFLKDKLEVYEALVRMCLSGGADGGVKECFAYIEQAKSRSLADLIAFRAQNIPAPTRRNQALVERVSALREELNWLTRALQSQENQAVNLRHARIEKLRRAARDCEQRLVEAMASLRSEDEEFAAIHGAGSVSIEAIRSVLEEDAMILQYYRVRDTFHACLLSRRTLKIVPLGSASELRRKLQLLRFQLSKFRLGAEYTNRFQHQLVDATKAHLQEFYEHLIAPIRNELKAGHLIVAPHEFLHYLPFHALLDGDEHLGSRYSISYSPSASVYYLCCKKKRDTSGRALILGVPDAAAPHILDEVQAVASVLPDTDIYLGEQVTQEVLREKGAVSRFIHIATHGWFRQDNPMFSSINLGNSQLSLFDLYQLNLPAELITLSGCGTGLNVVVGGDELIGLKRGLLYAGAQALMLTLWDVNDQSTAEFMKLFYQRLQVDPDKARAFQYATAEVRKAYAHPFYWAPFVLVGKYN